MISHNSLKNEELEREFIDYLIKYGNDKDKNNIYIALEELLEMSDRQWHKYQLMNQDIKKQIENYLKFIIDFEDEIIMDYILTIIPYLGLYNTYKLILDNKKSIKNISIIQNISDSENEYGNQVENPYSGM